MAPPNGYIDADIRRGMNLPGRVRLLNKTNVVFTIAEIVGHPQGLEWKQDGFEVPAGTEWTHVRLRIESTKLQNCYIDIFTSDYQNSSLTQHDAYFVCHDAGDNSTTLYNKAWLRKHFDVRLENSNNNTTHWVFDWKWPKAAKIVNWASTDYRPLKAITKIETAPSVLPVYSVHEWRMKTFFGQAPTGTTFEAAAQGGALQPAAIVSRQNMYLMVHFSPNRSPSAEANDFISKCSILLRGHYVSEGATKEAKELCTDETRFTQSDNVVKVRVLEKQKMLPWGMMGSVMWSFKVEDTGDDWIDCGQTPIEVYFITRNVLPHFLQCGVPVALCRKLLLPLRDFKDPELVPVNDPGSGRRVDDSEQGWMNYVIDKLHYQRQTQYDSLGGGGAHYWPGKYLYLDTWVDDCSDPNDHAINCVDLAALASAILPLGMSDVKYDFQMMQMRPFGLIRTAHLIGVGETNNPFAGRPPYSSKLICSEEDLDRSDFSMHEFLSLVRNGEHRILDATCRPIGGPPHAANETLEGYLKSSIEQEAKIYESSGDQKENWNVFWKEKLAKGQAKYAPQMSTRGTAENVTHVTEVTNLRTRPEVFPKDSTTLYAGSIDHDIYAQISDIFKNGELVSAPNTLLIEDGITLSWHIVTGNELLTLEISRCVDNAGKIDNTGTSRMMDLFTSVDDHVKMKDPEGKDENWPDEIRKAWRESEASLEYPAGPQIDGKYRTVANDGSGVVLWLQGTFFVHMRKKTINGLGPIVSRLQKFINQQREKPTFNIEVEGETDHTKPKECYEGERFSLNVRGFNKDVPLPCNVEILKDNALFLESQANEGFVTFCFLARFAGDDEITFATWAADLTLFKTKTVYINISKRV